MSPPRSRITASVIALALAGLASASACGNDFDPYNRLESLRVLAIQSQPVRPMTGETSTLTPVLFTPPDASVDSYAWSWCPFPGSSADGYPCLVTESQVKTLAGAAAGTVPGFDLGSGETASFDNTIDRSLLEKLCAGTPGQPSLLQCDDGLPVQVKLVVTSGDQTVTTVSTLRIRWRDDQQANTNPNISAISAEKGGAEVVLDPQGTVPLAREVETTIHAAVPPSSSESYTGTDERGNPIQTQEQLLLTWFVDSGDTDDQRTKFIDGAVPLSDALENTWTPASVEDSPADVGHIVVVVRDDREGVAWMEDAVSLEAAP